MNSFQFIKMFSTDSKLSRLRVFIMWSLICMAPTIFIILTTLKVQTYVVGGGGSDITQYLISMVTGIAIVPVLFTVTNGLRGYHSLFSKLLGNVGYFFVSKLPEELEMLGPLLPERVIQVEAARELLGFLTLEFIIIGWDILTYSLFNNGMSGLSLFGFMSDNLLIGAFLFILEATNVVVLGAKAFMELHTIKLTSIIKRKEKSNV